MWALSGWEQGALEGVYTGEGHGQRVMCSWLSPSLVGDHTKTNTNKPTEGTGANLGCFIYELSIGHIKKKKDLNKIKN